MNPLDQLIQYLTKDPRPPDAIDPYTKRPIRYVNGYMKGFDGKGLSRGKFFKDSKDIYISRTPSMSPEMVEDTTNHEILHSIFDTTDGGLVESLQSQGPWKNDDVPYEFEHFLINSLLDTNPDFMGEKVDLKMKRDPVMKMLNHVKGDDSQLNAIELIRRMINDVSNRKPQNR